nr:hypothetical protein [Tanacetum cinerariifolium]
KSFNLVTKVVMEEVDSQHQSRKNGFHLQTVTPMKLKPSGGDVFDLISNVDPTDEDGDIGMGDSTTESNIGDSDNTRDGGKIVGRAIGAGSGGIGVNTPRSDEDRLEIIELTDNDVTRLQALVEKKKVVVTEAAIREVLRLDDAEGVDCLPNEEIFAELARMGYEKPSTKLNFYKAFFSSQWKFLSTPFCRKFNFSKYIFDSLVRNVDSTSKFYMYPRFIQFLIRNQLGKGFSGVKTPLFKGMIVEQVIEEGGVEGEHVEDDTAA